MKKSAGLLMYRRASSEFLEVFLAHPGGPFWRTRDDGAWTLPKGEYDESEDPLSAALREFVEETGFIPTPPFLPLGSSRLKSGKVITAWAFEGNADPSQLLSNTFEMEWPPRSGRLQGFPEIDRAEWFRLPLARVKIHAGQLAFLDRIAALS